jgi:gamma-glutamyl:cysteine ligase YbdK (ATP-grasp superfamily)
MGVHIARERFEEHEFAAFEQRLDECVEALGRLLERRGFGEGPLSLGAELELHLVDAQARPSPVNKQVIADSIDPRLTLEIDRFNLEVNCRPCMLAGSPFTALADELDDLVAESRRMAARHGARPVVVGILPTLTAGELERSALSDVARYRALSAGLRRQRGDRPLALRIEGRDRLELVVDDVAAEGANASFQVHLRVAPAQFAAAYNAAQLATGVALAISGNSPLFLGRRLWDETRVAIFRQAVDDRAGLDVDDWRPARVSFGHGWVRRGALELFAEAVALHPALLPVLSDEDPRAVVAAGAVPGLVELRLHQGTVWRWNRAIYDATAGGHLRIELRALPAGPTVADMVANAAFLVGLTLSLAPNMEAQLPALPFGQVRRNFYQAACHGLEAEILWPRAPGRAAVPRRVAGLVEELLPQARDALVGAGVDTEEAARWLAVIGRRVARGRTGARWLRATYDARRARDGEPEALRGVVEEYLAASESGAPIADWPEPTP